jgi:hypothetical protein
LIKKGKRGNSMKKFGLLCLAIVLALGALGVGYAAWTDTIFIEGSVQTGSVCISIQDGSWEEVGGCPDKQWTTWELLDVPDPDVTSCPPGYHFVGIGHPAPPEDKCVADVSFNPVDSDGDGNWDELEVTINNAYPHLLVDVSFWVCNCGTIPLKIEAPIINQSPFLLIEYGDNIGTQMHPGGTCKEISFRVGVVQHEGYEDAASGLWIVDDPSMPILPQNAGAAGGPPPLSFTIDIMGTQWNDYPYTPPTP